MQSAASVQRKAKTPPPDSESSLERQADRAAEQVVLQRFAGVLPGLSALPGGTGVQRKCACGGICDKCKHEEEELRLQRAPDGGAPAPPAPAAPDPANPGQTPATSVLVDDGQPVGPDQMARGAFMAALRGRLFAVCDEELAPLGRSAQGCPYLNQWLGYYEGRPASVIERSIQRYSGVTAKKPQDLIEGVVGRVRGAVRVWATTGQVGGIPGVGAVADAAASTVSAVGSLFRIWEGVGAPARAHSPAAVQAQLVGGGGGLEPGVRSRMERGFGRSFAGVRVHTDSTAAQLSRSLAARAFTVGSDVAFAPGQYRPGTLEGDLLIAHELAHTVQQSGAQGDLVQSKGSDRLFENDADRAAAGMVGAELGLAERFAPQQRTGLRLQGCSQEVVKVCPRNYMWKVGSIVGVGSAGCRCSWKCMPYTFGYNPPPNSVSCPSDMNCDSGIKYVQLGKDYEKVGWGANMTPLGEQPWCGCFPLTKDGVQITDAPLRPSDIELTDVAQPVADLAAAGAAKLRGTPGPGSKVNPRTGTIQPDEPPPVGKPEKPGMTPPPSHVGGPPTPGKAPTPDDTPPAAKPPVAPPGATPPVTPGAKVPHEYTPEARSLAKRTGMPLDEAAAVSETLAKNSTKTGGKQMMGESEIAQNFGIDKNSKKLPEALIERNDGKFVAVEAKNQNEPDITNAMGKFRDTAALVTGKYGKYRMGGFELYVKKGNKGFNDKSYSVENGVLTRDGAPVKIDGVGVTVKERDLGPVGGKE
jgi:hypothetical protein